MNKRFCLFYQKVTLKEFWKNSSPLEKVLLIFWGVTALVMGAWFVVITVWLSDELYVGILLLAVWLLFPGVLFYAKNIEKSYWVELKESYVLRHGDYRACWKTEKIFYEQAGYITIGPPHPFLVPRRTSPKYYHKKYGDYINVTGKNNGALLTVPYSEQILDILKQKCIYANVINIQNREKS